MSKKYKILLCFFITIILVAQIIFVYFCQQKNNQQNYLISEIIKAQKKIKNQNHTYQIKQYRLFKQVDIHIKQIKNKIKNTDKNQKLIKKQNIELKQEGEILRQKLKTYYTLSRKYDYVLKIMEDAIHEIQNKQTKMLLFYQKHKEIQKKLIKYNWYNFQLLKRICVLEYRLKSIKNISQKGNRVIRELTTWINKFNSLKEDLKENRNKILDNRDMIQTHRKYSKRTMNQLWHINTNKIVPLKLQIQAMQKMINQLKKQIKLLSSKN